MRTTIDMSQHQRQKPPLRTVVARLKDRLEDDTRLAPPSLKAEIRTSLWKFAKLRKKTVDGIAEVSVFMRDGIPLTHHLNVKLAKVLLARYLIERLGELRDATLENPTLPRVALFDITRREISRVLSEGYLYKSPLRIRKEYYEAEIAINACAESCSLPVLPIEHAMNAEFIRAKLIMD